MKVPVTVLVVTYNQSGLVARCMDSILSQKTSFPFRVLVVDDASTDGTSDIVRGYASRNDNVEAVVRPANLGAAKNIGEAYGRIDTDFFILTEGDDFWIDGGKLQLEMDALSTHPECVFCAHRTRVLDKDGRVAGTIGPTLKCDEKVYEFRKAPFCHTTSRLYRNFLRSMSEADRMFVWRDTYLHFAALDRGPMVYLNREMSVYNFTGNGIWTSRSPEEQARSNQAEACMSDQFLGFRHTMELRRRYLPESPRRLFSLSLPYSRKWKVRLSLERISAGRGSKEDR